MTSTRDDWTPGEARIWARRLRKVGFSPVTLHYNEPNAVLGIAGSWYLLCNWPFDLADAPTDLLYAFVTVDYGGIPELYGQEHYVGGREPAQRLLAEFRAIRIGMGSRPFPRVPPREARSPFAPGERILTEYNDWPVVTQRHPESIPE